VTQLLAAEKTKKFRVEFVHAPDDSWCLLLVHWPWARSGWALATDTDAFDGGRGSGLERWDIVRRGRVPARIRVAYAEDIRNWRALAAGRIRDERWYGVFRRRAMVPSP
jgi:hypothetical protein